MTKEQLDNYKSKKSEIGELKNRLNHLGDDGEMVGHSVINDYRSGYPVPNVITGVDWERYYNTQDRIAKRLGKLSEECGEIEEWVEAIEDSLTRRIFRMYYIDSISQENVARTVGYSRGRISQIIAGFMKD